MPVITIEFPTFVAHQFIRATFSLDDAFGARFVHAVLIQRDTDRIRDIAIVREISEEELMDFEISFS